MSQLWAGSPESYNNVAVAKAKLTARMNSNSDLAREKPPVPYQLVGDVGVVSVKGSLIAGSAGWMQLYGVTGYDDINAAILQAVQDQGAKSIMFDVDSPGGSVSGIDSPLGLIRNLKGVKPTNVFTSSMGSAAFWIGSAAGHITAERFAQVGSVGAVATVRNIAKYLEDAGIKYEVIRSDPGKMAVTPYEELTDDARADLEAMVQQVRDMFVADLATNTGLTAAYITKNFGAGKSFLAEEALSRKMIHAVGDYSAALAKSKRLGADKKK